jgi:hypothetical protein
MRELAIQFSVLAIGATALGATALLAVPAEAKTPGQHMHHVKHHKHWRHHAGPARYSAPARPLARYYNQSGPICPQVGHSFDCKIWPPPYEDDPDRKTSKY